MDNNIKKYRKQLGFLQEELAQKCAVSRQTINSIENNRYDPSLNLAFKLAQVLGVKVDDLFNFEDK
ncbi:helix-turn-helix transcriptional regulator [Facklamia miroungae]|uniref:Putative transcriptional regulator n=1 Tax=Facklamia miroungae TaxID=120956 RepID=A0A1G7PVU4_9LACT|nr:helix-turn-helix transcriptional regulator [Facklamia miroungae]NKZ28846.1 helix-turn-helix transcriptional regulator [Facklamia miroungae]SDF90323.1 putative transcriptional regulator [Facklamia miroungae]